MPYYYEKTSSYLTDRGVKSTLGKDVLDYSDERKQELGLFPASNVSYEYNPYTHKLSTIAWTKYDTDSDFRVANPYAIVDDADYQFPGYVGQRSIVSLSDSAKETTLINAKKIVFEETADRMARVAGASLALSYNALSFSDSAASLADNFSASDSDIFSLAYDLQRGDYSNWIDLNQNYLGSTSMVADVVQATDAATLDFSNLPDSAGGLASGKLYRDSDTIRVVL